MPPHVNLLAIMGLVALAPASALASGHALLVGSSAPQGGAALPGAEADVAAMSDLLTQDYAYDDVKTLVGSQATRAAVADALKALVSRSSRSEPVVVYFAGAGAQVADINQDEPDPWDEAWVLADGLMTDDVINSSLQRLSQRASLVTYIVDASLEPAGPEGSGKYQARFSGHHTPKDVEVREDDLGVGDGAATWAAAGPTNLVIVEGAYLGPALETSKGGVFTQVLVKALPGRATYVALESRLQTKVASKSVQVPRVRGARDEAVFDRPEVDPKQPPMTTFEIPDGGITVRIREGDRPDALSAKDVRKLERAIRGDADVARRVTVVDDGDWTVRRDPASRSDGIQIVGPEGGVRNTVETDSMRSVTEKVAQNLWLHGQQSALLGLDVPDGPVRIRMVPLPDEEQSPCAAGEWTQSEPNQEQVVPMCWRWQLEVQLRREFDGPAEVGGVIMANDGTMLGFPMDGQPVVLQPGERHRFTLQRPGRPPGLRSVPPLHITEHVLAFAAPVGANVRFDEIAGWSARSVGDGKPVEGQWVRGYLPFRVEANRGRPERLSRAPLERLREVTLNQFDVSPYLPANPQSLLYKVLQNAERLTDFNQSDGLRYAQCWPHGSGAINNKTRFSERQWPGDTCWAEPYDFGRDDAELGDSPGIDCSTTMWFIFTRACSGNEALDVPVREDGERNSPYQKRLRAFHTEERGCLLFTDEDFRGGFVSTNVMANQPDLMTAHWDSCLGEPLQTGDMLVTRNSRNTSGHTYIVVDPERFVVFGSHAADTSWSKLQAEERALWEEFEEFNAGERDAGTEYQFLTWYQKSDLVGTELEKWMGFARERVKACWRHRRIVEEWERDPSSRPGSRDLTRICQAEQCR